MTVILLIKVLFMKTINTNVNNRSSANKSAVISAVLYCSWPLGYVLNPGIAHQELASQLQASAQPFNWLFVLLDVLCGLCLVFAGYQQWRYAKSNFAKASIICYTIFAILVITAALVPFNCTPSGSCNDVLDQPLLLIHGIASVVSVMSLLAGIIVLLRPLFRLRVSHMLRGITLITLLLWAITGILAYSQHHNKSEYLVEYAFITLCSFSIVLVVHLVEMVGSA